jgi:hypothetical protein
MRQTPRHGFHAQRLSWPEPTTTNAGTRSRQCDTLLSERHTLVPKTCIRYQVAQWPQILRIIGIELDCTRRLNPKQIGLARHPRGTGDKSTHECIMGRNLDGPVCGFNGKVG